MPREPGPRHVFRADAPTGDTGPSHGDGRPLPGRQAPGDSPGGQLYRPQKLSLRRPCHIEDGGIQRIGAQSRRGVTHATSAQLGHWWPRTGAANGLVTKKSQRRRRSRGSAPCSLARLGLGLHLVNLRKPTQSGGWRRRRGCNTTGVDGVVVVQIAPCQRGALSDVVTGLSH